MDQPLDRLSLLLWSLLLLCERQHLQRFVGSLLILLGIAQYQRIIAARVQVTGLELRKLCVGVRSAWQVARLSFSARTRSVSVKA